MKKLSEAHEYILDLLVQKGSRSRYWIVEIAMGRGYRVVNRTINTLAARGFVLVDEDDYVEITSAGLAAISEPSAEFSTISKVPAAPKPLSTNAPAGTGEVVTCEERLDYYDAALAEAQSEVAALTADRLRLQQRNTKLEDALTDIESTANDGLGEWSAVHYDQLPEHLERYYFIRADAREALNAPAAEEAKVWTTHKVGVTPRVGDKVRIRQDAIMPRSVALSKYQENSTIATVISLGRFVSEGKDPIEIEFPEDMQGDGWLMKPEELEIVELAPRDGGEAVEDA